MIPFLVDMARLFELFVAEWLRAHLPATLRMQSQETVAFGARRDFRFQIDIVLSDAATGRPLMVIDTKYKTPSSPDADDVAQAVAYAEAKGCRDAILLYPVPLSSPLDVTIGEIRVRSLAFPLEGDLEERGMEMMGGMLSA